MATIQDVVQELREFLYHHRARAIEELMALAAAYAEACREANDRARRCLDQLRHGQPAEAVRLARLDPDLFDRMSTLELPNPEDWLNECKLNQLEGPPPLLTAAVTELREAEAFEERLRPLMERWRLQSLARAPLRDRLATLAALVEADPGNPLWKSDLLEYVRARDGQLLEEAAQAAAQDDLPALEALIQEATQSPWSGEVAPGVRTELESLMTQLKRDQALRELEALLPELEDAYLAMDDARCRAGLETWKRVVLASPVAVPVATLERARPIAVWLEKRGEERARDAAFGAACGRLRVALESNAPVEELTQRYQAAAELERPMDPELVRAYRLRLLEAENQRRRRGRSLVVLGLAFVVLAGGGVALALRSGSRDAQAQRWVGEVEALLLAGRSEEAAELLQSLGRTRPELEDHPGLAEAQGKVERALRSDAERSEAFDRAIQQAEATQPDKADAQQLALAKGLARTVAQKARVVKLEALVEQATARRRAEATATFAAGASALGEEVARIDPAWLASDYRRFADAVVAAERKLAQLGQAPGVDEETRSVAKPLALRLGQLREALTREMLRRKDAGANEDALRRLIARTDSVAGLVQELEQFAERFPDSPRAPAFREALRLREAWRAIAAGMHLVSEWDAPGLLNVPALGDQAIEQRRARIARHRAEHPASPFSDVLGEYALYLEAGKASLSDTGPWRGELKAVLSNPLLSRLWHVDVRLSPQAPIQRYYLVDPQSYNRTSLEVVFDAIASANTEDLRNKGFKAAQIVSAPSPAPQVAMSRKVLDALAVLHERDWAVFGLDACEMIAGHAETDPIVRAILVQYTLELTARHGYGHRQQAGQVASALRALEPSKASWMDPEAQGIAEDRARIKDALERLAAPAAIAALRERTQSQRRGLREGLSLGRGGLGVLLREPDTGWRIETLRTQDAGAYVLRTGEPPAAPILVRVGQYRAGQATLQPDALAGIPEGSVVFLSPESP